MISDTAIQKIEQLAAQVAEREGVRIYDIEFSGGSQGRTLRIFIDKENGIGIDDCANVSRGLNLLLDVEDPIPGGKYVLEVSSPGLERPLKKPWHFQQAVGKTIWFKTQQALETFGCTDKKLKLAKQLTETLLGMNEDQIQVKAGEDQIWVPLSAIEKAKTVFDHKQGKHEKKGQPKKGSSNK